MAQTFAHSGSKPRAPSPSVVIRKVSSVSSAKPVQDEGHFPRHYDKTWAHPVPRCSEIDAIRSFKAVWKAQRQDGCTEYIRSKRRKEPLHIDASDYEIYTKPEKNFLGELHSLDYMDVAGKKLFFNGVLSLGSIRHYVQGLPVTTYSIEGYGVEDDPNATVYIVSTEATNDRTHDIWYRLGAPCHSYKRFQDAFQWVATLGKHVIDYMDDFDQHLGVSLSSFRRHFDQWLRRRFPDSPEVSQWLQLHGSTDFRKSVHRHIQYLWSEAMCLQNVDLLQKHPLWDQCGKTHNEMIEPKCEKTVATPHVFQCFKNRYFAGQITEMQPSPTILVARERRLKMLGLPSETDHIPSETVRRSTLLRNEFEVGDVICIAPDEFENQMWRKRAKDAARVQEWIGYVQRITALKDGHQRLYVIWLYRPEDTTISTTDYPVSKELFMSDNCNCQEHKLLSSEVSRRCSVEWFSKRYDTRKEFFVRQKYETETSSFVTMKETDFRCSCQRSHASNKPNMTFCQGDTVYLLVNSTLEPVMVEEPKATEEHISVRRLMRMSKAHSSSGVRNHRAVNELVWTDVIEAVPRSRIEGRCYVRYFPNRDISDDRIRFPYDQGGTGHCWILSMRLINGRLEELTTAPECLRQAPDYGPVQPDQKLSGLSLFSGLGNLDKGLEAGGAVHFHTCVDMNGRAIQTLNANADEVEPLKLWFGSVDDYLHALLSGTSPHMKLVAPIGSVGVIAGGSPCPGFSKLQQNWLSEQSLRNAAHVTTFASFVDVYRPEYGFLENVVNMGVTRKGFEEELVLSQLIGCLVSMGYQVQQFIMSSWHYGSPQHRNRLILSIAAPGCTPLAPPRATHNDPHGFMSKSVGKLLNGERFGVQDAPKTPFPHMTPGEKMSHLPDIGCGIMHPCIGHPDHVLRLRPNIRERRCIAHVPKDPPGVGLEYAAKRGLVPKYLYETRSEISKKSYRRIKEDGLVGTIVTGPSPHDSRAGPFVHWEQNRCITLEESRLAQDIPPEEVLIGNLSDQCKMVGNAVDRRVSKALGLELRRAIDQDAHKTRTARTPSVSVVINVKRTSRVDLLGDEAPEALMPQGMENFDRTSTATTSRSVSQDKARQNAPSDLSVSSRSKSSSTTVRDALNIADDDDDDQGPVPRGRRINAHIPLLKDMARARESIHQSDLDKQIKQEFGFGLKTEPGGGHSLAKHTSEQHGPSIAPFLAMSRNGLPGLLSKSRPTTSRTLGLSASPSPEPIFPELITRAKRPRDYGDMYSEERTISGKRSKGRSMTSGKRSDLGTQNDEARKTRHSGLSLEYRPKAWYKTVENEVRTSSPIPKKSDARPYA